MSFAILRNMHGIVSLAETSWVGVRQQPVDIRRRNKMKKMGVSLVGKKFGIVLRHGLLGPKINREWSRCYILCIIECEIYLAISY